MIKRLVVIVIKQKSIQESDFSTRVEGLCEEENVFDGAEYCRTYIFIASKVSHPIGGILRET